jgi:hypothetical protein
LRSPNRPLLRRIRKIKYDRGAPTDGLNSAVFQSHEDVSCPGVERRRIVRLAETGQRCATRDQAANRHAERSHNRAAAGFGTQLGEAFNRSRARSSGSGAAISRAKRTALRIQGRLERRNPSGVSHLKRERIGALCAVSAHQVRDQLGTNRPFSAETGDATTISFAHVSNETGLWCSVSRESRAMR